MQKRHLMLSFVVVAVLLAGRRTHREGSGGDQHQLHPDRVDDLFGLATSRRCRRLFFGRRTGLRFHLLRHDRTATTNRQSNRQQEPEIPHGQLRKQISTCAKPERKARLISITDSSAVSFRFCRNCLELGNKRNPPADLTVHAAPARQFFPGNAGQDAQRINNLHWSAISKYAESESGEHMFAAIKSNNAYGLP